MPATGKTQNYNLPQYQPTDKPKYLTDFNGAMSTIDTAIKSASDKGTSANTLATEAKVLATQAKTTADTAKKTADTAKTTADQAKATAEDAHDTVGVSHNILHSFFEGFTNIDSWQPPVQ